MMTVTTNTDSEIYTDDFLHETIGDENYIKVRNYIDRIEKEAKINTIDICFKKIIDLKNYCEEHEFGLSVKDIDELWETLREEVRND